SHFEICYSFHKVGSAPSYGRKIAAFIVTQIRSLVNIGKIMAKMNEMVEALPLPGGPYWLR
ncbi:MAG: hypothetical protein JSW55_01040, partial [Chloroflexota bacterium]